MPLALPPSPSSSPPLACCPCLGPAPSLPGRPCSPSAALGGPCPWPLQQSSQPQLPLASASLLPALQCPSALPLPWAWGQLLGMGASLQLAMCCWQPVLLGTPPWAAAAWPQSMALPALPWQRLHSPCWAAPLPPCMAAGAQALAWPSLALGAPASLLPALGTWPWLPQGAPPTSTPLAPSPWPLALAASTSLLALACCP